MRPAAPFALVCLLVMLGTGNALAQRQELAVVAGATYTGATGPRLHKTQSLPGFMAGLSLRLPRSPQISFQSEFLISQRRFTGSRAPSTEDPLLVGPQSDAQNLIYALVPLGLRFQQGYSTERPVRPFLSLGVYAAARIYCRREVVEAGGAVRQTDCNPGSRNGPNLLPAVYQDFDVGFSGGVGVELRGFAVSARFDRSLRNAAEEGALPTTPMELAKFWTVSFAVEYLIRVR
ncbi:MAG: outer membrane beta-barrel protein [Gemmatimonadales bacterium]|nr:outer membrane beta-barrel protein [Gemmatimonadales bacterium]